MFKSARPEKISVDIIKQIHKAIFDGKLRPGDRLPPERELIEKFNVSKATIREALRSLEMLGFLEIRKGQLGGAFITEVDSEKANEGLRNFIYFKGITLKELNEVRLAIEPFFSKKAAFMIGEDYLNRLKQLMDETETTKGKCDSIETRKKRLEFHKIIANVVMNPIFIVILDFVEALLIDNRENLKFDEQFSRDVKEAHKRIYDALLDRDGIKAQEEMTKHIQHLEKVYIDLDVANEKLKFKNKI